MYAIIETGSKQYRVEPGQVVEVEKLEVEPGSEIVLDHVLLVGNGEGAQIGRPYVSGAKVRAKVVENGRDTKVTSYKFKRKVNYHRTKGHRQHFTRLEVVEIVSGA